MRLATWQQPCEFSSKCDPCWDQFRQSFCATSPDPHIRIRRSLRHVVIHAVVEIAHHPDEFGQRRPIPQPRQNRRIHRQGMQRVGHTLRRLRQRLPNLDTGRVDARFMQRLFRRHGWSHERMRANFHGPVFEHPAIHRRVQVRGVRPAAARDRHIHDADPPGHSFAFDGNVLNEVASIARGIRAGARLNGKGRRPVGDDIMIVQRDGSRIRSRMTLTPLEGGRVRQLIEQSSDEGATWTVWFDGTYVPHSKAGSP